MKKGYLSLILHAHLPYVRHPEFESFFEEIWLFEAITECYLPLIAMFDRLQADNVKFRLTVSLSPTLISMIIDPLLQHRYQKYLQQRIELAEKEIQRNKQQQDYQKLARLYRRFFFKMQQVYQVRYQGNLLSAFKKHYLLGNIDLITTAATHAFLPLLNVNTMAVQQQIDVGIETFKSHLGFSPSGFWLPECAYYPGLEAQLANTGINYFFVDSHATGQVTKKPGQGLYAPVDCGNGVFAFARDPESSYQVWSAEAGYPGHAAYREYYRDIGFELDLSNIKPYILDDKTRINTGIKYHSISRQAEEAQLYDPRHSRTKAQQHAQHFINKRIQQIDSLVTDKDRPALIVAPYDAELFGHWWFEGPLWLENVLRLSTENSQKIKAITCADYLKKYNDHPMATPTFSSWGEQGDFSYWLNESNDWIYPFLHKAADEMQQLTLDFKNISVLPLQKRALNQALRSLLLAQASDWPFILSSGTTTEYARKSINDYLARFNYLHDCIRRNRINERYLLALETMDNIFPEIDYRKFDSEILTTKDLS